MRCAFVLLCALAFIADASVTEKRSALSPNPNDVTTMSCGGAPCATPPYVFNTKGGKVIPLPTLCIVYWGTTGGSANSVPDLTQTIDEFVVDVFQNSDYADGWSEYGVLKRPSLHPKCGTGISIVTPPTFTDSASLESILRDYIADKTLPPAAINTHFVIFLNPSASDCSGAVISDDISSCGFHAGNPVDDLTFTVIPDYSPNSETCNAACVGANVVSATTNQVDWFEATKAKLTQLVANAVTDPFGDAWNDPEIEDGGEIGDLCFDFTGVYEDVISDHVVQKWYSQQRKACVTRHLDYIAEAVACGTYDRTTLEPVEWGHHPYDCTDQYDHSRCMYCKGWANGKIVKQCLPRLGAKCNPTFDTAPRAAFCNLEFECAGSFLGMNVVMIVSVALLFTMLFL